MFKNTPLINHLEVEARRVIEHSFRRHQKIAVLFSGGKDSTVLIHLVDEIARKNNILYDIIHIDTGYNFPEILSFRDKLVSELNRPLLVEKVNTQKIENANRAQSESLKKIICKNGFDIVLGGGRRDEDKARRKELFFSKRKNNGGWTPETPQVEISTWGGLNKESDEHFRVFPLNNWTEFDIWTFIGLQNIEVCPLYYKHLRGKKNVRYRTIGDKTNSTPIESDAKTPYEVAIENITLNTPERSLRLDDQFSEHSMEIRKKEGYF